MVSKVKRVLNLSADKVNGYVFKDSPSIYWSWWHIIATVAFVVLIVFALCSPFRVHAATLPIGERLECRIEVENVFTGDKRVTFKAYDSSKIKEVGEAMGKVMLIKMLGDEQVPEAIITTDSGELFAVADKKVYRGICRNGKSIKVLP